MTATDAELLLRREQEILVACRAVKVHPRLLTPMIAGRPAPIVLMLEDLFQWDEASGAFYVSDGKDGFVLSTSPDIEQTYMSIAERVWEWAADPENAVFLEPRWNRRFGRPVGLPQRGTIVLSHEQASDGATYQDALKRVGGDHSKITVYGQPGFGEQVPFGLDL